MKQRALQLKEEVLAHRRYLHQCAEVGLLLPRTMEYLSRQLRACGIEPQACGHGIRAQIGAGAPRLLLRADADALPNGHTCGHDCHAAMLLTAAKMLKEREGEIPGSVCIMFQPAEETLQGAQDMIRAGILQPMPQAALAFHTAAGKLPPGMALYGTDGAMMYGADNVTVTFSGKGGHGAYGEQAIDPIKMAVEAYGQLPAVSIGVFQAGNVGNAIAETAVLKGALRTEHGGQQLLEELEQVAKATAEKHGGRVEVVRTGGAPPLICHKELTRQMAKYLKELGLVVRDGIKAKASEDFAYIAQKVPAAYFYLTCGFPDARGDHLAHDPLVQIDEEVLPIGAAAYAHCAMRFLQTLADKK